MLNIILNKSYFDLLQILIFLEEAFKNILNTLKALKGYLESCN